MPETRERASFNGKLGFIMATSASAVGLGNLWRFPYETSHYGGGIFVLVYVILAFSFGMCLMLAELSFGRRTGKSCVSAFGEVSRKHRRIGQLAAAIPMLVLPYYCVIGGWVAKWLYESSIGNLQELASDNGSYWFGFITGAEGFGSPTLWFLVFTALCMICILAGVKNGIEKLSKALVPALLVLMIGITAYELTIPGTWDGVVYYLNPDINELSADTFLGAVSQIFYSMSIAIGISITYGSYTKKDVDLEQSAGTVALIDSGVAILAGLMIVPVAFMFGFGDSNGMGLMFEALPQIFVSMPGGSVIGPVFYFLVLLAALTSAVSLAETCTSVFTDGTGIGRGRSILATAGIILFFGLICVFGFGHGPLAVDTPLSQGAGWLGFFDTISNSILMPVSAILMCLFIGYVARPGFLEEEIEISSRFRLKKVFTTMIKYVCPILLTVMLVFGLYNLFARRENASLGPSPTSRSDCPRTAREDCCQECRTLS